MKQVRSIFKGGKQGKKNFKSNKYLKGTFPTPAGVKAKTYSGLVGPKKEYTVSVDVLSNKKVVNKQVIAMNQAAKSSKLTKQADFKAVKSGSSIASVVKKYGHPFIASETNRGGKAKVQLTWTAYDTKAKKNVQAQLNFTNDKLTSKKRTMF